MKEENPESEEGEQAGRLPVGQGTKATEARRSPRSETVENRQAQSGDFPAGMSARRAWTILGVMVIGQMASALNQTTMTSCLAVIMNEFGIQATLGQWLTTAYMLVLGIMMPLCGHLMTKYRVRPLFAVALGIFFTGAMIGAFQHSFTVLVIGRCIQACGSGLVIPIVQIVVFRIFPYERRGEAMGVAAMAVSVAPAIGPVLAGILTDTLGWRSIFTITGAMALVSAVLSWHMLRGVEENPQPHHLDVPSFVLSSCMAVGIVLGCSNAGTYGVASPLTLVPAAIGLACVFAFVRRELRIDQPLLDIRAFSCKPFALACVTVMILQGSVVSINNFVCLYVQDVQGLSATLSGLTMLPGALAMMFLSPIAGRMLDHHGPRLVLIIGFALMCSATLLLSTLTPTTPLWMPVLYQTLRYGGTAFITQNIVTWGVGKLGTARLTQGMATANALRQMGCATVNATFFSIMDTMAVSMGEGAAITSTFSIMNGVQVALGATVITLLFTKLREESRG